MVQYTGFLFSGNQLKEEQKLELLTVLSWLPVLMGKWVHEQDIIVQRLMWPRYPRVGPAARSTAHGHNTQTKVHCSNLPVCLSTNRTEKEFSRTYCISIFFYKKTDLRTDDFLEFPIRFQREADQTNNRHCCSLPVWRESSHAFPIMPRVPLHLSCSVCVCV